MEGILKVTPEKLISTSQEFSSNGDTISSLTQQMIDIVTSLSSFWQGDASSAYSAQFNQLNDDIQMLVKMVKEHLTDLQTMASKFTSTENQNIDIIQNLSGDVIV